MESSAEGRSSLAQRISSSSLGEVAPRIDPIPSCTMSAHRARVAGPMFSAWRRMVSACSTGASTSPRSMAWGTDCTMIRSRNRWSRSAANRRGSSPASMTLSTVRNSVAPSPAASASTVSSINATSVAPSRLTARE